MTAVPEPPVRLIFAFLLALLAEPAFAETPVARHGQLSIAGGRLVDARGEPVTLRGMSLFWSQWGGRFYNPGAIRWLAEDWKVDVVRVAVGVPEGGILEHPERELAKADTAIQAAIDAGLYVVIDWHAHEPEPEAAAVFFEHVARRWGDTPNVIYETWNEPLPKHGWAEVIKPYHEALIPRIRAIDPDGVIVAGTRSWSQDVDEAAADPLPFPNVAYTLHYYAASHGQDLRDKAQAAVDRGAALFITEYGTTEASGDGVMDVTASQAWWDFAERNGISHLNWSIMDKAEASAALVPGAPADGGWSDADLTPSGRLVRDRLRAMAED